VPRHTRITAQLQAVIPSKSGNVLHRRWTRFSKVDNVAEEVSNPAGLMISIMRAGVEPAFHMACNSPRGLVIYPPASKTALAEPV
jgi:hypothetical protein